MITIYWHFDPRKFQVPSSCKRHVDVFYGCTLACDLLWNICSSISESDLITSKLKSFLMTCLHYSVNVFPLYFDIADLGSLSHSFSYVEHTFCSQWNVCMYICMWVYLFVSICAELSFLIWFWKRKYSTKVWNRFFTSPYHKIQQSDAIGPFISRPIHF